MPETIEEVELELKEKIKAFLADSVIRNLFLCELVPGFDSDLVFRGATITKEGAEYLRLCGDKCDSSMCGFRWWATLIKKNKVLHYLSCLETWLTQRFVEWGTGWGAPPEFLHRWRQEEETVDEQT